MVTVRAKHTGCRKALPSAPERRSRPLDPLLDPLPIAVLVSGRGTNLQSLINAGLQGDFAARIALVVSNKPGVEGLVRAARAGIRTAVFDHRTFASRESFDDAMRERIDASGARLVVLAGFMRRLSPGFVAHYRDRLINIHPSLLPAFPGLDVHRRVIESGARFSGCTVHFVRAELDAGPIILQAAVPVHPGDTEASLAARVLEVEHGALPQAVRWFAEGRLKVEDERVQVDGAGPPTGVLVNPFPVNAS